MAQDINIQDTAEKKVDYLAAIYFSGLSKAELLNKIDITLQQLEGKEVKIGAAKQYTFLHGVKGKANAAEKSCDVLEFIATGIYQLDAQEAVAQGVERPSEKAKASLTDLMSSINGIGSSANDIGASSNNLAWQSWVLSGGKASGVTGAASKVGNAAGTAGSIAENAGTVLKTVDEGKKLLKVLGLGKDKPCEKVPKKEIIIGNHDVMKTPQISVEVKQDSQSKINGGDILLSVQNISFPQIATLTGEITKINGVSAVKMDKFNAGVATFSVNSSLDLMTLTDSIIKSNSGIILTVENIAENAITLIAK